MQGAIHDIKFLPWGTCYEIQKRIEVTVTCALKIKYDQLKQKCVFSTTQDEARPYHAALSRSLCHRLGTTDHISLVPQITLYQKEISVVISYMYIGGSF